MKKYIPIILVLAFVGIASATVTNWGGNTFTGLVADIKPTNVPNGSRFFEIDAPFGVYVRSASTWTLVSGVTTTFSHNDMTGLNVDDYLHMTAAQNSKLDGIATGAEVNVNADWNSGSGDAQILNKPTLATVAISGSYSDLLNIPSTFSPIDHAGEHVTGGGDIIANAVASGNAGLLSGTDKAKLDGIATGAEVNINADWNSGSGDSQILNKPTIPSDISGAHYITTQTEGGLSAEAVVPTCSGTDKLTFNGTVLSCGTDVTGSAGVRVTSVASAAPPTPNIDTTDQYNLTAQAEAASFAVPSGTPSDGQKLIIRIKDDGTARGLSFNAIYRASADVPLPTTTVIGKTMYLGFIYNDASTKWDFVAFIEGL